MLPPSTSPPEEFADNVLLRAFLNQSARELVPPVAEPANCELRGRAQIAPGCVDSQNAFSILRGEDVSVRGIAPSSVPAR